MPSSMHLGCSSLYPFSFKTRVNCSWISCEPLSHVYALLDPYLPCQPSCLCPKFLSQHMPLQASLKTSQKKKKKKKNHIYVYIWPVCLCRWWITRISRKLSRQATNTVPCSPWPHFWISEWDHTVWDEGARSLCEAEEVGWIKVLSWNMV